MQCTCQVYFASRLALYHIEKFELIWMALWSAAGKNRHRWPEGLVLSAPGRDNPAASRRPLAQSVRPGEWCRDLQGAIRIFEDAPLVGGRELPGSSL